MYKNQPQLWLIFIHLREVLYICGDLYIWGFQNIVIYWDSVLVYITCSMRLIELGIALLQHHLRAKAVSSGVLLLSTAIGFSAMHWSSPMTRLFQSHAHFFLSIALPTEANLQGSQNMLLIIQTVVSYQHSFSFSRSLFWGLSKVLRGGG